MYADSEPIGRLLRLKTLGRTHESGSDILVRLTEKTQPGPTRVSPDSTRGHPKFFDV